MLRRVVALLALACFAAPPPALAEVKLEGTFTASKACPAFQAFRQMERDLVNGSGLPAPYRSEGRPGFGLRFYETP